MHRNPEEGSGARDVEGREMVVTTALAHRTELRVCPQISSSRQLCRVWTVIIPIVWMSKLRHREAE